MRHCTNRRPARLEAHAAAAPISLTNGVSNRCPLPMNMQPGVSLRFEPRTEDLHPCLYGVHDMNIKGTASGAHRLPGWSDTRGTVL